MALAIFLSRLNWTAATDEQASFFPAEGVLTLLPGWV
jgi:hypothetical protein